MRLKPVGKRVIVKPDERPTTTPMGLHLVNMNDDRRDSGVVLAVGESVDEDIEVGDKVIYAKYAGAAVKFDDEEVVIHHQADIWAVVER